MMAIAFVWQGSGFGWNWDSLAGQGFSLTEFGISSWCKGWFLLNIQFSLWGKDEISLIWDNSLQGEDLFLTEFRYSLMRQSAAWPNLFSLVKQGHNFSWNWIIFVWQWSRLFEFLSLWGARTQLYKSWYCPCMAINFAGRNKALIAI